MASSAAAMNDNNNTPGRKRLINFLKDAAAKAVMQEDPWGKYNIPSIPAELVIRHLYHPETKTWSTDRTIVKIEKEPFTNGAMRYCYRMKKRATPPNDATNHRFHSYGWDKGASNYVAKAYFDDATGTIDCSEEAKDAVRNDVLLQYEASYWSELFNKTNVPPKKISFIKAYALEFPNRPGKPLLAVERFISGKDSYGAAYVKHNTNSGFVDLALHRTTPQVFTAHSFYASKGKRLVADIQGVGNLYTDPQVLSNDYRFGDGDLGPRGMALFFKTFRHCQLSDAMGIPVFKLSKNELKLQSKYDDDEWSDGTGDRSRASSSIGSKSGGFCVFAKMDQNRQRRASSCLNVPPINLVLDALDICDDDDDNKDDETNNNAATTTTTTTANNSDIDDRTCKRSNMGETATANSKKRYSLREALASGVGGASSKKAAPPPPSSLIRSKSAVDEVKTCIALAQKDAQFSHTDFNRNVSGEIRDRHKPRKHSFDDANDDDDDAVPKQGLRHKTKSMARMVSPMIIPDKETMINLGKVHFQLAILHGMGRFVDDGIIGTTTTTAKETPPSSHDAFSVLFHLSHASSLGNAAACLSIARVQAGLETVVSNLLPSIVPVDFDSAKDLLQRTINGGSDHYQEEESSSPAITRAAAGCLLHQIYQDEKGNQNDCTGVNDLAVISVLETTLTLLEKTEKEESELEQHRKNNHKNNGGKHKNNQKTFKVGDRVDANYAMEGSFYPGCIDAVAEDGLYVTVRYDDDGSTEQLQIKGPNNNANVVLIVPPNATCTNLGGPLSDEEAFGFENSDEKFLIDDYDLKAELAHLLVVVQNDKQRASALYEDAANGAMNAGKMRTASQWSMKAAELL